MTKHIATSTKLLSTNIASRESSESSRCSDFSESWRLATRKIEPAIITASRIRNGTPSVDAPNAWMELSTPERTRNVPRIDSTPVASTSDTFQVRSIPRRSWIITLCRNAVAVSHGITDAFSTGSHIQ